MPNGEYIFTPCQKKKMHYFDKIILLSSVIYLLSTCNRNVWKKIMAKNKNIYMTDEYELKRKHVFSPPTSM